MTLLWLGKESELSLLSLCAMLLPLFFLKSGTLILGFFGIIIIDGGHTLGSLCLRSGFALAPLLRLESKWSQGGGKVYPKWEETALGITCQFVG